MRFAIFQRGQFALEKRKRKKEFAHQDAKKKMTLKFVNAGEKGVFLSILTRYTTCSKY